MTKTTLERVLQIALLLLFMTACQGGEATPTALPTLASGKAMVVGQVVADKTGQPLVQEPVWLAEVRGPDGQAAFALNTSSSPLTRTDQRGKFVFANLEPDKYVIVVGDPNSSNYQIISESPTQARVWELQANQTLDVGELRVWFNAYPYP